MSKKTPNSQDQGQSQQQPGSGGLHAVFEAAQGGQTLVTIVQGGVETVFSMPRTDIAMVGAKRAITLLDAAEQAGLDLPYSCCGGVCATCCARLHAGTVEHIENHVLDPEELSQGYLLVCQAVPTSDRVEVRYE